VLKKFIRTQDLNPSMAREPLIRLTEAGLYCPRGGFHIDPWNPVSTAVITHAHGDHAVRGSHRYVAAEAGRSILQLRMGPRARIQGLAFGEPLTVGSVRVSLHPAGHILGSAQVRVEDRGEVWVVSGDYKVAVDRTCDAFEPVHCDTFITESTFGHPRFQWEPQDATLDRIHQWWRANQQQGRASVFYAYSLGKAQRLLAGLDPATGPILVHPDLEPLNDLYRAEGVNLPETASMTSVSNRSAWERAAVLLPPAARWDRSLLFPGPFQTAFVSGWMVLPGETKRRGVHAGFALSDHGDFEELLTAVRATGAQRVAVTHGYIDEFVTSLKVRGFDATSLRTPRCKRPPALPQTV